MSRDRDTPPPADNAPVPAGGATPATPPAAQATPVAPVESSAATATSAGVGAAARAPTNTNAPPAADYVPVPTGRSCQNCGVPLYGEHCHACGQPTKGLVRHFSSIIGDFMDSVFELDSRILRTLGPLLLRPGYLTTEYFAGRRIRYVSPVRLFVFLAVIAFFVAQLSFDFSNGTDPVPDKPATAEDAARGDARRTASGARMDLGKATTPEDVARIRDEALAAIDEASKEVAAEENAITTPVGRALDIARRQVAEQADERLAELRAADERGEPPPMPGPGDTPDISFNGEVWDPETNPLKFEWLPDAGNRRLNAMVGRAQDNLLHIQDDPNRLKDAILSAVPTTLFVLLPLFALILRVFYLFSGRIYMEHLIVALHSHAFLCLSLLLMLILDTLVGWTASWAWLSVPLSWLETAVGVWMPVYLLLMQKRVYGQGWLLTLLKYFCLGFIYLMLVSFGSIPLFMVTLVNM